MSYAPMNHFSLGSNIPVGTKIDNTPGISLRIRQEPQHAKVAGGKDKDRKPIDPPPVVQLQVNPMNFDRDVYGNPDLALNNPFYFVTVALENADNSQDVDCTKALYGVKSSSLYKIKEHSGSEVGYFVFGDLAVKKEGHFRLLFTLYEMVDNAVMEWAEVRSSPFQVHGTKTFPGMQESTTLTKTLAEHGVRVRLRKDSRMVVQRKHLMTCAMASDRKRSAQASREDEPKKRVRSGHSLPSPPQAPQIQHAYASMNGYPNFYAHTHSYMAHVPVPVTSGGFPLTPTSINMPGNQATSTSQGSTYETAYSDSHWDLGRHVAGETIPGVTG